jgi:cell division protein FtsI/penicillin-binding protein 2
LGIAISGGMGPAATPAEREAVYARGFPHDWPVGLGGLEAMLEPRIAGRPGGKLLAGSRVVATATPRAASTVHTTIDLRLEAAAQTALAGRLGGIAALDAHTGHVRALAGIAFSGPQPPGSTFKIVTLAAALENRVAKTTTRFPFSSYALIDGVKLQNANGEVCGGSVAEGFVQSCNSVYAPLGVRVGAKRLVAMAERFGWNRPPPFPRARPSTLPEADAIGSKLALGSSAIGQGKVLATPLQMAMVAQAIAAGGLQRAPTIVPGPLPRPHRVISTKVAHVIRKLMLQVVARGTGTSAAIGSGVVAGKTGTAELESTTGPTVNTADQRSHTDAWFTSFAPAKHPRIVVAVMLVRAGAGGATAAPAARTVLQAALSQ